MTFWSFVWSHFRWHYTAAVFYFLQLSRDWFQFIYHFFSVPDIGRRLFGPWSGRSDPATRLLGGVLRLTIIVFAAGSAVALFVVITTALVLWLLRPFLILNLVVTGLTLLIP